MRGVGRVRGRRRGRILSRLHTHCGTWSHHLEIMTWVDFKGRMLNQLSYPGLPEIIIIIFLRFYLFSHGRHRERERQRQAEGEAGSMQGARRGTRSGSPGSGPGLKAALTRWATWAAPYIYAFKSGRQNYLSLPTITEKGGVLFFISLNQHVFMLILATKSTKEGYLVPHFSRNFLNRFFKKVLFIYEWGSEREERRSREGQVDSSLLLHPTWDLISRHRAPDLILNQETSV